VSRPRQDPSQSTPTPYEGKDGKWHVYVPMGRHPDGRPDRKHLRRKTRKEVVLAQRRLEAQRDRGEYIRSDRDATLGWWVTHWLDEVLPLAGRKAKTVDGYRSTLRVHVLPHLAGVKLSALSAEVIFNHLSDMKKAGATVHTIASTHRVLRSCLSAAVDSDRIRVNQAKKVNVERPAQVEVEPLTVDEAIRILGVVATRRNGVRWSIALSLGLRQGEALGLKWVDLDLDTETVIVRRSLRRETGRHGCERDVAGEPTCGYQQGGRCSERTQGGLVARTTKTGKSRMVPLPPGLAPLLRAHQAAQSAERLQAGWLWQEDDWVFATELGAPIDPRRDWGDWKAILAGAGVRDARVHDARHTAATLLLANGVDIRTLMDLLGWTEHRTAQRYAHVIDPMRREAMARMGVVLFGQAQ
jgi:integrase